MMPDYRSLPRIPDDTRSLETRKAVAKRFSDPPIPAPLFKADGSVQWPENWSFVRKIFEIDFTRRECTPGLPARPLEASMFVRAMVASLQAEIGDRVHDLIFQAEKKYDAEYQNGLEIDQTKKLNP